MHGYVEAVKQLTENYTELLNSLLAWLTYLGIPAVTPDYTMSLSSQHEQVNKDSHANKRSEWLRLWLLTNQ